MLLDNKTIVFQGDSITDMARGRELWDLNHVYGHSYVFLLASQFGYEAPEKNITIYNRGISGNRTVDLYARWKEDTLNLKPDVVSILVGINDILMDVIENAGVDEKRCAKVLSAIGLSRVNGWPAFATGKEAHSGGWCRAYPGRRVFLLAKRALLCYTDGRYRRAGMAELADALDLGSSVARRAGSTPVTRTMMV